MLSSIDVALQDLIIKWAQEQVQKKVSENDSSTISESSSSNICDEYYKNNQTIQTPDELNGQMVGALLKVRRKHRTAMAGELDAAIGDIVQVKEISNVDTVWAENKRTGSSGKLAWKAVHNIGPREMCDCLNQRCDCMYDDFSASQIFAKEGKVEKLFGSNANRAVPW